MNNQTAEKEICYECGKSVAFGSGRFVNRIPSCNTTPDRRSMGVPFPEGGWLCEECDIAISKDEPEYYNPDGTTPTYSG